LKDVITVEAGVMIDSYSFKPMFSLFNLFPEGHYAIDKPAPIHICKAHDFFHQLIVKIFRFPKGHVNESFFKYGEGVMDSPGYIGRYRFGVFRFILMNVPKGFISENLTLKPFAVELLFITQYLPLEGNIKVGLKGYPRYSNCIMSFLIFG